jgi:peptide/nickel transport system permease protein
VLRIALRRLAIFVPTLFVVTLIGFWLQVAIPGDAAYAIGGPDPTPEQIANITKEFALNDPAPQRYWHWLTQALQGNLGTSYTSRRGVWGELWHRFPVTASLTLVALVIIILLGIPLGVLQGLRAGTRTDKGLLGVLSVAISAPGFWVATMLVFLFAVKLKWLPALGYVQFGTSPTQWLEHIFLPAFTLALGGFGIIARFLRTGIVGVRQESYVRALRARGLSSGRITFKHVLRNASLPAVTILGLNVGYLLSGAVIVEQIFTLPGMGSYALGSVQARNAPAIQGVILLSATVIMLVNLATDLTYSALNPKVRLS